MGNRDLRIGQLFSEYMTIFISIYLKYYFQVCQDNAGLGAAIRTPVGSASDLAMGNSDFMGLMVKKIGRVVVKMGIRRLQNTLFLFMECISGAESGCQCVLLNRIFPLYEVERARRQQNLYSKF